MLQKIIDFSIHNKLIILIGTIFLIGYGSYQLTQLPIDAVPDITDNQVQIITSSPSLGAPDVERFISFPIEQATSNIPGLKEIRSFSRFGLSVVTIVFNDDIDVYWARQQVTERLQSVKDMIPAGMGSPVLSPVTTGLGEIYQYVIRPKKGFEARYSPIELRTIQDWIVRRQLLGVAGVADVSSFGGLLKQYQIAVNSERLRSFGLTIDDVFAAIEQNNQNAGGAYIERGPVVLFIRSEGLIGQIDDIKNIVIKRPGAAIVRICDVAEVEIGSANRFGAVCYNDEGEAAGAVLMMLKGENSSAVIKRVKEKIEEISKMLPEGVQIEPFLDRTKMVNNAISTVQTNLIEGALIVIFVLVVFLGNLRAGLTVASVIPLSMLFAVILMNQFGVQGNLMSLGAIDFGLIVDGAVIIVEAVMYQLFHTKQPLTNTRRTQAEMDGQVKSSAGKMMSAAIFGQAIILIVYLPIFTLDGIEGKMFKPMAQTVIFALLGAFVLSLTYVPMMTTLTLSKKTSHKANLSDRIMARLEKRYERLLSFFLRFPKLVLASVLGLMAIAIWVMMTLGGEFIPELEEGDFAVETRVLMGSNLATTIKSTQQAAHILLERFPEVEKVVTKMGSGEIPTDPMSIEASDMMIILKDKSKWTSAKTFDELAEKMSKAVEDVPGVTTGFQFPVQMRFNELMTGARQDVVCKIFGEDLDSLSVAASQLGQVMSTVEGVKDLYVEAVTGMPQIVIEYNRVVMAQYGLNISDLNRTVNAAFAGATAGQVYEGEKRFDLVVKLDKQERSDLKDVQNLLIATPSGAQMPLSHFASVEIKEGPAQIQRENAQRRIIVGFNARGRDVQSIVTELQQKVETQIKLPTGYHIVYSGSFENLNAAKKRLSIAVPISLALIFLLLFFAFNSVRQGLLVFSAIPLSAIGGVLALAMRGMPFSISAGIGFIALFGVAVLNGIVLLSEFNRLRATTENSLLDIVKIGTRTRLRPVLMTAAVASLGFIPMAFSDGAGAEVQRPLASVVIGGLLSATFLTLFVLPVLYLMFEKRREMGKIAALIGMFMLVQSVSAQTPIGFEAALDTAVAHNLRLKAQAIEVAYYDALVPTAKSLEKADLAIELGQVNSQAFDYKWTASQTFSLPVVYQNRQNLIKAQGAQSEIQYSLIRYQLAAQLRQQYADHASLVVAENALLWADNLYAQAMQRALIRLRTGETNALELAQLELQRNEITIQLAQNKAQQNLVLTDFNRLLVAKTAFTHFYFGFIHSYMAVPADYPLLQLSQSQVEMANLQLAETQALQKPEWVVGVSLQSIRGFQNTSGTDRFYGSYPQFAAVQGGIRLPLDRKAGKAKIEAAQIHIKQAVAAQEAVQFELDLAFRRDLEYLELCTKTAQDYQLKALPAAENLLKIADELLQKGEIDFMDWIVIAQQTIAVRQAYALANQNIIQATAQIANY
jgi:heavy metal efflux system protein